jgi:quinol monooxygenase YgiN
MQQTCAALKADAVGIKACKHDVEALLRSSGLYSYEWLRQERLRWHPDRFGRLCEEGWREVGRKMAEEMFKIVDALVEEVRAVEGRTRSGGGK